MFDDGTEYQMEFNVFWVDKRGGNVRVCGDITAAQQRPLFGFIPVYTSDATDSFIIAPTEHSLANERSRYLAAYREGFGAIRSVCSSLLVDQLA